MPNAPIPRLRRAVRRIARALTDAVALPAPPPALIPLPVRDERPRRAARPPYGPGLGGGR